MTRIYSETEVVARVRGLTVTRLRAFVAADCVRPAEAEGRLAFAEADLARVQLLEDLVEDFDLDEDAAAMVVSLVDQNPRPPPRAPPPRRGGRRRTPRGPRPHHRADHAALTGAAATRRRPVRPVGTARTGPPASPGRPA